MVVRVCGFYQHYTKYSKHGVTLPFDNVNCRKMTRILWALITASQTFKEMVSNQFQNLKRSKNELDSI